MFTDKQFISQLGKKIKQFRSDKGLAQWEMAEMLHMHRTYFGAIERGEKNPTLVTLLSVSRCLGIKLVDLLDLDETTKS